MSQIDKLAESLAESIVEERVLNKESLIIKIKTLLKVMFNIKSLEYGNRFKPTTLDYVSSVSNKNKYMSNFWREKVKELAPDKMKSYYDELKENMMEKDFNSKRVKKINEIIK